MCPDQPDLKCTLKGGAVATLLLTGLMYLAPIAGLPRIDMASAIGGFLGEPAALFSLAWWIGLIAFLTMGIVVSPILFLYALPALYGKPWLRGMQWGVLVWGAGGVGAMIWMGLSFHEPFVSHPHVSALVTLMAHLAYGAVLGVVGGRAVEHLRNQPVFT